MMKPTGILLLVVFCFGLVTSFCGIAVCHLIEDPQVQQTFGGSVIQVEQERIQLKMYWVRFYDMHGPLEVYLNWEGTKRYQVIDPTERLPDKYEVNVENQCPFDVEVKFTLMLDGQKVGNPDYWLETAILHPKGSYAYDPGLNVDQQARYLSLGDHTASWLVQARRAGSEDDYVTVFSDSQSYGVYTPELNAISTRVEIVQRGQAYEWLTGTLTGFIESLLQLYPGEPVFFRFHLQNDGDEPVCMNIAHLNRTGGYETGFFVDGTWIAPLETDILLDPGSVAVIDTQTVTPTGDMEVDEFVILAKRCAAT